MNINFETSAPVGELYELLLLDCEDSGAEAIVHLLWEVFGYPQDLCRKIMLEAGGPGNTKHQAPCFTGTLEECRKHYDMLDKFTPVKIRKVYEA